MELINQIGLRGDTGRRILKKLNCLRTQNRHDVEPWFALWHEHCAQYFDLAAAEGILAKDMPFPFGTRLFLAHSYCKIVLSEMVALCLLKEGDDEKRSSLYDWVECVGDNELADLRIELRNIISDVDDFSRLDAVECSDFLAGLYQEILPPPLRHLLGEYYTPSWLVQYCINLAEQIKPETAGLLTILDPSAGSGGFLANYIAQLSGQGLRAPVRLVGFDVNPLAVDFCYANARVALYKTGLDRTSISVTISIFLTDAVVDPIESTDGPLFGAPSRRSKKILGVNFLYPDDLEDKLKQVSQTVQLSAKSARSFEQTLKQYVADTFAGNLKVGANIVVGNPPWITWDGLSTEYRDKVAPQWASSTLVTNTGWKAKISAGKTDFSSLFVYRTAQRHAVANAVMIFVLPMSLFQSRLAAAGFRTFKTVEGRTFPPVAIDDFSNVKVFPDAVNRTSVGTFIVDKPSKFPIPYRTWRAGGGGVDRLECISALGGPLDPLDNNSPIIGFDEGLSELQTAVGRSDYRARGGVNTGGANTILWLEVLERTETISRVRNIGKTRKASSPVIEAEVETGAVFPLLCGPDLRRWKADPGKSILLFYSADQPKKAIPVSAVKEKFPKAYDFVLQFKGELEGRKEYHRWGCSGPFYEVYRIGPYTFSPIKVVWQHTGYRKALNVSVINDRNRQVTIPDQKAIIIPFDAIEEAHYVCAFLSSSITASLLNRYLGTDASTHILDFISLRRYVPRRKEHNSLSELSLLAHDLTAKGGAVDEIEKEIDAITAFLVRKD